jgi:hypothetical protein
MGAKYEPQTFGQPVERSQTSLISTRDIEKYFRPSRLPIKKVQNRYKIDQIKLYGEDFLCAPYHLWQHDAEAVVAIMYGEWCKLIMQEMKLFGKEKQTASLIVSLV